MMNKRRTNENRKDKISDASSLSCYPLTIVSNIENGSTYPEKFAKRNDGTSNKKKPPETTDIIPGTS